MGPVEALQMALKKEEGSIKLYQKMALEHSAIKGLLQDLINEEILHKKKIEDKIKELTRY